MAVRFVVGLGNPGERYRRTRHNIGFMVVDAMAAAAGAPHWHYQWDALVVSAAIIPSGEGQAPGPCLLVKPQTFMNRSGLAVAPVLSAHGGAPEETLVVVDDVALELGTLRLRERGGHGGHNGLRSLVECLGTEDFPRLRVGIRAGEPQGDLAEYVLAPFPEDDVLVVQELVGAAAEAALCAVQEGTAAAMSCYNGPIKR
jgi:peptidyl-tRNA hydrolase, PTH1 family